MYKERKETIYIKVGEEDIHHHIRENKYNVCLQMVIYKNNVPNKERKEKIHDVLTTSLKNNNNTPPNTMIPKTN